MSLPGMRFNSHKKEPLLLTTTLPETTRCAIGLSLDMKTEQEHILIGEFEDISSYILGNQPCIEKLLVNEVRPFGSMIEELFTHDALAVTDAATAIWPDTAYIRPDLLIQAGEIMEEMYASDNLVRRFTALRLWQEYRAVRGQQHSQEIYDRTEDIILPLRYSHENEIKQLNSYLTFDNFHAYIERNYFRYHATLMYRVGSEEMSIFHVSDLNVLPLYLHYLHTVYTKKRFFQYCKRCGRLYPAHTANSKSFCSEECRAAQQKDNRQRYNENHDDEAEKAYKNCYMYWYNRLKKIFGSTQIPEEKKIELKNAFKAFRNEATTRKKSAQSENRDMQGFINWLLEQRNYFDQLTEDIDC